MYEYIKYGADRKITLAKNQYAENDNLAVEMVSHDEDYPEAWSDLTVNLSRECKPDCAFIDTNDNGSDIIDWLVKNDIAYPTGRTGASGFCVYPEVKFTDKALSEMEDWL